MTSDDELRALFSALRSAREAQARDFGLVLADGRQRAQATRLWNRRRRRAAALASVPLALALGWYGSEAAGNAAAMTRARSANALVHWQSPTASLLDNPYADWLRSTPALSTSVIVPPNYDGGTP